MIKVLQNWEEIGRSTHELDRKSLPRHGSVEKCWDLFQLYQISQELPRSARAIDLGCSGLHTLKFLYGMGFRDLTGVDLHFTVQDRLLHWAKMWRQRSLRRPYRLCQGDMTRTGFPGQSFDLASCVSVIEHGVDCRQFMAEAGRLLKKGGKLLLTADYWQEPIDVSDVRGEFGLDWNILSRKDIEAILVCARESGFALLDNQDIPACQDRCLIWNKKEYTAICLGWVKC